jgi:hypothetical protein
MRHITIWGTDKSGSEIYQPGTPFDPRCCYEEDCSWRDIPDGATMDTDALNRLLVSKVIDYAESLLPPRLRYQIDTAYDGLRLFTAHWMYHPDYLLHSWWQTDKWRWHDTVYLVLMRVSGYNYPIADLAIPAPGNVSLPRTGLTVRVVASPLKARANEVIVDTTHGRHD